MKYKTLFYYDDEGQPSIVIAKDVHNTYESHPEEYEQYMHNPDYFLEEASFDLWERYEQEVDMPHFLGWKPTKRQRDMIKTIIDGNPEMILQFVPACTPEEFGSFGPGKVPQEPRTINNLWSHKEYFDKVRELRNAN